MFVFCIVGRKCGVKIYGFNVFLDLCSGMINIHRVFCCFVRHTRRLNLLEGLSATVFHLGGDLYAEWTAYIIVSSPRLCYVHPALSHCFKGLGL